MIERIVSGGQTGVDRAALDFAIRRGIAHGGWCPRGRRSERGRIPAKYRLAETASPDYPVRTALNVQDSDGTLVITRGAPGGGTRLTVEICRRRDKPCLVVDLLRPLDPAGFAAWVGRHGIRTLNVAGPRASTIAGIGRQAARALERLFAALPPP
jgi:hypothetical protein